MTKKGLFLLLLLLSASVTKGQSSPIFSITFYGAICDGQHQAADTAGTKAAFLIAGVSNGTVTAPAGTCNIDNSGGPIAVNGFNGRFIGQGKSTSFVFNTLANDGFDFTNSTSLDIEAMSIGYSPPTTTRQTNTGYPLNIDSSSNVTTDELYLNNGNLSGLRVGNSNNVKLYRTTVSGFLANGIFTVNNNDLSFFGTKSSGNGDAAEEASYYDSSSQQSCERITSIGLSSDNDVSGFIVNGCSNATWTGFNITHPAHECYSIGQDSTTTTTHFADNVTAFGICSDAGYGTNVLNRNTAIGAEISYVGTPSVPTTISLGGILKHIAGRGVQLGDNNTTNLALSALIIDDAGNGNTSATGEAIYLDGNIVTLHGVQVANAGTYSLRNHLGNYVKADDFTSVNPNKQGAAPNAIINEVNGGYFVLNGPTMLDNWPGANRSGISNLATSGVQKTNNYTSLCTVTCSAPNF